MVFPALSDNFRLEMQEPFLLCKTRLCAADWLTFQTRVQQSAVMASKLKKTAPASITNVQRLLLSSEEDAGTDRSQTAADRLIMTSGSNFTDFKESAEAPGPELANIDDKQTLCIEILSKGHVNSFVGELSTAATCAHLWLMQISSISRIDQRMTRRRALTFLTITCGTSRST